MMIDITATTIITERKTTSVQEEITRNVQVIISTVKGQVAFDRDFGMDPNLLDMPIADAQSYFLVQAVDQVRLYEPRAIVQTVEFDSDMNGNLRPKVVIGYAGELA